MRSKIKQRIEQDRGRFDIDFFEFSFLVEACIPPRPIARAMFWDDVIDKYYHVLTQDERDRLFDWINRCSGMEHSLKNKDENCLLFNARFDKDNQYVAKTNFNDEIKEYDCFKWKEEYYISKRQSISNEYIIEVIKK
jgi:hypothetical protein